jgi:hypothetical protein
MSNVRGGSELPAPVQLFPNTGAHVKEHDPIHPYEHRIFLHTNRPSADGAQGYYAGNPKLKTLTPKP